MFNNVFLLDAAFDPDFMDTRSVVDESSDTHLPAAIYPGYRPEYPDVPSDNNVRLHFKDLMPIS